MKFQALDGKGKREMKTNQKRVTIITDETLKT